MNPISAYLSLGRRSYASSKPTGLRLAGRSASDRPWHGVREVRRKAVLVAADPSERDQTLRRGYHHGNLRETLIEAALSLISSMGRSGFTFAEAARAAGASPAALYRHFRDRDALIAEVALRGYLRFERSPAEAWQGGQPNPRQALDAVGRLVRHSGPLAAVRPATRIAVIAGGRRTRRSSENSTKAGLGPAFMLDEAARHADNA